MKKTCQKSLSLLLTVALLASMLAVFGSVSVFVEASVVSRDDGTWLFPLSSSYYNSFTDWAGCYGTDYTCPICGIHHTQSWGDGYHGGQGGHNGIDIYVPNGTSVMAASDGTIVAAAYMGARGNTVVIEHKISGTNYSYYSYYQHLSSFTKTSGSVNVGTV
ncbi:MAG: M23 family metallopeptidase, partial [Clostridia bacterium]|nr:M23 family metallopeptidase [Clostridia bacterium]